jgi:hypothetical protein
MLGLGVVFLVVLTPYALNYLSFRGRDQGADYETVMTVLRNYWPANLLNTPAALGEFLWNMTRNLLLPVAVPGFIATWLMKKADRTAIKVVLFWMAGIFITSAMIPVLERLVEQRLHILPIETELVRGIRYFVPLFLLFWLWPLAEWSKRTIKPKLLYAIAALGIALFGFWAATNRPDVSAMLRVVTCTMKGQLICKSDRSIDDVLKALETQTRPGEGVLAFNEDVNLITQSLSVRYAALRPLVYTSRDAGILGYSNRGALKDWLTTTRQVEEIRSETNVQKRMDELIPLAKRLGANYLVVDFNIPADILKNFPATALLENNDYTLVKLR